MTTSSSSTPFSIKATYKTQTLTLTNLTTQTTIQDLHTQILSQLNLTSDAVSLKLLSKGKQLGGSTNDDLTQPAFPTGPPPPTTKKILILATPQQNITEINSRTSDPTIRGFDNEVLLQPPPPSPKPWGPITPTRDRNYKFCKLQSCTWQSFGHRPTSQTPHAFRAHQFLERLDTDPGIVAVMTQRELVVNTLAEMDPIDDRIKQKHERQGKCLLGYNTNHGLRIDVKLRTPDLKGFLSYQDVAATLLHELSHNWVDEHNVLFWTNYGQMRLEYLYRHAELAKEGYVVKGKTTAQLAGIVIDVKDIYESVVKEVRKEARQHGVSMGLIGPVLKAHWEELSKDGDGQVLRSEGRGVERRENVRELALAAAERRKREQQQKDDQDGTS